MVKPIMRDLFFLRQKAEKATKGDFPVAIDLLDTLKAHEDGCVGMAANMIGVNKAIIAVNMGFMKRSGRFFFWHKKVRTLSYKLDLR